jgi:hypothetical protein
MRYHYETKRGRGSYGVTYLCDHPVYDRCTLYVINGIGLAVVQQRFDRRTKKTWWDAIDSSLIDDLYLHKAFYPVFLQYAKRPVSHLYPTLTIRQLMWALRMKPLPREPWETAFDHKPI